MAGGQPDAFLECGILAHGFLRLRCGECGHDKLLAFSCKRRGFCPSCGARRMSQTAAHLIDHVIPHVPVRQWVLSLPIPLRVLLAAQPALVTPVLQVVQRVVARHLLEAAGLKADEGHGGAVTLIQRFGSAANLNIHLHCLVLDGVYRCDADGLPTSTRANTGRAATPRPGRRCATWRPDAARLRVNPEVNAETHASCVHCWGLTTSGKRGDGLPGAALLERAGRTMLRADGPLVSRVREIRMHGLSGGVGCHAGLRAM